MRHRLRLRALFASALGAALALAPLPASANPAVLIDPGTGQVIAHRQAFERWYPASLTKLMTAYVAFRAIKAGEMSLTSGVRVSKNALSKPPSKMGYPVGSVLTLENALKILMVKSANDIATAVAENIGKGEKEFVARMNAEARRLGMTGTHFVNPHGLHDDAQYSTARDIAILASQIRIEFPEYAPWFSIEALMAGDRLMETFNVLIRRFPGADGMKTGFVCASGFNMVASATRNNRTLIAVVLGASSQEARAVEAADLLAAGFAGTAGQPLVPIVNLAPYGDRRESATNMREAICSKKAQSERFDQRDEDGKLIINSPYFSEPTTPPVAVAVAPGGATDEGWFAPEYADVPTPTPRPDYTPTSAAVAQEQGDSTVNQ